MMFSKCNSILSWGRSVYTALECVSESSILFLFYGKELSDNEYRKCAYHGACTKILWILLNNSMAGPMIAS